MINQNDLNNCNNCKFLEIKTTTKSKINYGYCKELKLATILPQENCKHFKGKKIEN